LIFSFCPFLPFSFVLNTHPPSLVFPVTHFPLCLCDFFFSFFLSQSTIREEKKKAEDKRIANKPKVRRLGM